MYSVDSSADAVYLYDKGKVYYEGNTQGFFSIVQERFCRIRLLHKQAFSEVATIEIPLYTPQKSPSVDHEKLSMLEAATYNLENGKVETVKVDKASIFKQESGNFTTMKFTFPNIKEGSIIEFHYKKVSSRFWDMDDWFFQGQYPRIWSEFQIAMPEIFDFIVSSQGYHKVDYDTAFAIKQVYNIIDQGGTGSSNSYTVNSGGVDRTWGMSNVPALKPEAYISSLRNYVSSFNFQISALKLPNQPIKNYRKSWNEEAKNLMKDDDFGKDLSSSNSFLNDDLQKLGGKDDQEKIKNIYNYVRDNYSCTKNTGRFLTQSLRQTWKTKKGNVADINLLLIAALRNRGFSADPLLIGKRQYLRPSETYPFMDRFNYVVCKANFPNGKYVVLDAADKHLGFNHLDEDCYNGFGRVINETLPILVPLSPDSLVELTTTIVNIDNAKENSLTGYLQSDMGYFNSQQLRTQVNSSSQNEYFEKIKKSFSFPLKMSNTGIDSLSQLDFPVSVHYDFDFETNNEGLIYFNPIFSNVKIENPFKVADRIYPIEMPYKRIDTYIFSMAIPKGYEIDDIPKSAKVSLNETDGMFQYLISAKEGTIKLMYKIELKRATFDPEDYNSLREFFAYVVKKQNEPIVFKKIKN